MVSTCPDRARFKIWLKSVELKGIRYPLKIDDISRVLAGVDDDFDVPDRNWCPWWHFGWSGHAMRELCLKEAV